MAVGRAGADQLHSTNGRFIGGRDTQIQSNRAQLVANQFVSLRKSSSLYDCEFSYLQVDPALIKFAIHYLDLSGTSTPYDDASERDQFQLSEIHANATIDELVANTTLDPKLPFVFFINGFNTLAPSEDINSTWMYEVARGFALRHRTGRTSRSETGDEAQTTQSFLTRMGQFLGVKTRGSGEPSPGENESPLPGARNAVFLTWSIPDLFASNLFAMIPAYYKTVANYDQIVGYTAEAMLKIIEFVEISNEFGSEAARSTHFAGFDFYGHSLGSHILSDAILRVVNGASSPEGLGLGLRPKWKFGKLTGLDPATPCFASHQYGISSQRVSEAVHEVAVLHSNAGLAGISNERTNLEIVLNGGTFQPGCAWYDFTCSHVRSTEILGYIDDDCQMVAYRCTSYTHFKQGACETCPKRAAEAFHSSKTARDNCILVNLPEQHRDRPQVLAYAEQVSKRRQRLAAERLSSEAQGASALGLLARQWRRSAPLPNAPPSEDSSSSRVASGGQVDEARSRKTNFYYVNTNPAFMHGRKSHCLQHYQLRLLIYNEDARLRESCRPSGFFLNADYGIKLRLFHEVVVYSTGDETSGNNRLVPSLGDASTTGKSIQSNSGAIRLNAIVKDLFFTGLTNFESGPRLFVGAQLENLDLAKLAACYKKQSATASGGPKFVLDIAFMSHTDHKIRDAYSSVLCGQLNLDRSESTTSLAIQQQQQQQTRSNATSSASDTMAAPGKRTHDLMLDLCKQTELKNVSAEVDKLLDQIKLQLLDETRKVSMLNSLFSLFTQWEPF